MLSQGEYANPLVPVYLFPRGDDFSKYQYYERYDVDRNIKTTVLAIERKWIIHAESLLDCLPERPHE